MTIPTRELPGGDEIPALGLGTWNLQGETLKESVRAAIDSGYTHLDTAEGYANETELGEVLAEYDRSPAQVVVRWGIQRGVATLPKSSTPEHVRANADLDWELDDDDVRALDDRDREYPVYDTPARDWSRDRCGIER